MTSSQSETQPIDSRLEDLAGQVADAVNGRAEILAGTIKVHVDPAEWVAAHTTVRDRFDLVFFSWLSAIDWSNHVAVGDPPSEEVDESLEVLTTVADLTQGNRVTLSTKLGKDEPSLPSLVEVYAGANWHEREAAEMFGIDFEGHPDLSNIYLLDGFIGNPLRKSYPLLSREVKPWPGTVDVEGLPEGPSEENPEA